MPEPLYSSLALCLARRIFVLVGTFRIKYPVQIDKPLVVSSGHPGIGRSVGSPQTFVSSRICLYKYCIVLLLCGFQRERGLVLYKFNYVLFCSYLVRRIQLVTERQGLHGA